MFSKDSRWDRHLPHRSYAEEPLEVGVIFKKGKIIPKWFVWKQRRYPIQGITCQWTDQRGAAVLYYFTVSDGANLYRIHLNNRYLHWRLDQTCPL